MPLDAIDPTFINAPSPAGPPLYTGESLRRDIGGLLAPGATVGTSRSGVLDARALAITLSGNNVLATAGPAAVASSTGAYLTGVATSATVDTLVAADANNPRRDRVILQVWDPSNPQNDGTSGGTNRKGVVRVLTGDPDPLATTGGGVKPEPGLSLTLAFIDVPKSGNGSPVVTDQRPITAAAGAPIPVNSLAEARALPKVRGLQRIRMDLPGFPTQVYNGTVWTHVGPWKRTTFTVNSTNIPTSASDGTGSRAVATLSMNAEAYDRRMKVFVQTSVNSGAIASGISRWDVCASLMQSQAANAQTRSPLCWTAPGNYLMSSYIETEEIIVPANSQPIPRFWVDKVTGNVFTGVSVDPKITKFWVEECPADEA